MGQKVHPLGFRVGVTQAHDSCWVGRGKSDYARLVEEDNLIRRSVEKRFKDAGIMWVGIEREADRIRVYISATRPQNMFEGFTLDVEPIECFLAKEVTTHRSALRSHYGWEKPLPIPHLGVDISKLQGMQTSARFVADSLVEQLERRVPFRKAMKLVVRKAEKAAVKGIKVQVSGRLNGAEIARTEWSRTGRVPLQTLRAWIDYSFQPATTIYGLLGVKVWVFGGLAPPQRGKGRRGGREGRGGSAPPQSGRGGRGGSALPPLKDGGQSAGGTPFLTHPPSPSPPPL